MNLRISDNIDDISSALIQAAEFFRDEIRKLSFTGKCSHVYNPLQYAWKPHRRYIDLYGGSKKRVVFLGMNPGPFGMAQTGVPFGEITAVSEWIGIREPVYTPEKMHPKRPVEGFSCPRSEVSGRRFWGLMKERFGSPAVFFDSHFVANYCPLLFLEESGRNLTPDKLPAAEREALNQPCDRHLERVIEILSPEHLVGIGKYAEKKLLSARKKLIDGNRIADTAAVSSIPHPSPANPLANRDWAGAAAAALRLAGVWE